MRYAGACDATTSALSPEGPQLPWMTRRSAPGAGHAGGAAPGREDAARAARWMAAAAGDPRFGRGSPVDGSTSHCQQPPMPCDARELRDL